MYTDSGVSSGSLSSDGFQYQFTCDFLITQELEEASSQSSGLGIQPDGFCNSLGCATCTIRCFESPTVAALESEQEQCEACARTCGYVSAKELNFKAYEIVIAIAFHQNLYNFDLFFLSQGLLDEPVTVGNQTEGRKCS